jgi:hypothetical protein
MPRITLLRLSEKPWRRRDSVVPRETNTLLFRAISAPHTGQITVETLLKSLFRQSL